MSKTEDRQRRRALAESLAPPTVGTTRAVCPVCNGGNSGEETLVVSRHPSGDVSAKCFRASCEFVVGQRAAAPAEKAKEPRFYTRPTRCITSRHEAFIWYRFGLPPGTVDAYSESDDRFVLTVRAPSGRRRGVVAHSLSGGVPKTLTYNESPSEPFIHWTGAARPVVIVEDWFSAEKVAEAGGTGVAILGTNLSREMVAEIAAANVETVIALDYDAFAKSLTYQARYAEQFPKGLRVWRLARDLKYQSIERIRRAFAGETDFHEGTTNCGSNAQGAQCV